MFLLFHTSLRDLTRVTHMHVASRLALSRLAEIRAWARKESNFRDGWDSQTGTFAGDEPGYQVIVRQEPVTLFSPCSRTEKVFGDRARKMNQSCRKVEIRVTWGTPGQDYTLVSLVSEPPRKGGFQLRVRPDGVAEPLEPDKRGKWVAQLRDGNDQVIPDVMFTYHVLPGWGKGRPGNAVVDVNHDDTKRSGESVCIWNRYPTPVDWSTVKGDILVKAGCRYRGLDIWATSEEFQMAGP